MTRSRTLTRYWDARLDPLNWREPREGAVPSVAGLAVDAFATPDTRAALDLLGDLRGEAVLELACGHGAGAQELTRRGARAVGLDISPRRCAVAAAGASGAQFCAGDAQKLPFADGAFDAILARDILMYADTSTVARECARVLRPAGRAVFVESLVFRARPKPCLNIVRIFSLSLFVNGWVTSFNNLLIIVFYIIILYYSFYINFIE